MRLVGRGKMNKVTDAEETAAQDSVVRLGWPVISNHLRVKHAGVAWNELE